jgi:nickel/cobalt transporter (NicO) family protein
VRGLLPVSLAALVAWLGCSTPAAAHRLDEYLQATRVSIGIDRIDLEIDLTPGAATAATVVGWIDTDGDGRISVAEGQAYAQEVLGSVVLSADGRRTVVTLVESRFPEVPEMMAGLGTIRLRAAAAIAASPSGRHVVTYVNRHRSQASVYLANALVPADGRITIASQERDPGQHMLTLEYDVAYGAGARTLSVLAGLAMVGLLGMARMDRGPRRGEPIAPSPLR